MKYLKTNTATRIAVGPFLDYSDGVTPEVSITVTNTTCELYKDANDGGAVVRTALTLSASGGNNDMVHITDDVAGYYDLELTTTNTNFLGRATLVLTDPDVHLPVFQEFMVLPAKVFDSLVAGTDNLEVLLVDDAITSAKFDESTAYPLKSADNGATALSRITVADILAGIIEGSITLKHSLQAVLAACAGKSDGGGTATIHFKDQADSKNRITATVDASGNRTAITTSYD